MEDAGQSLTSETDTHAECWESFVPDENQLKTELQNYIEQKQYTQRQWISSSLCLQHL